MHALNTVRSKLTFRILGKEKLNQQSSSLVKQYEKNKDQFGKGNSTLRVVSRIHTFVLAVEVKNPLNNYQCLFA